MPMSRLLRIPLESPRSVLRAVRLVIGIDLLKAKKVLGMATADYPHLTLLPTVMNLVWVTIGNMIGGVTVGATYWFIYLRKRGADQ